jgi:hypothetical protein
MDYNMLKSNSYTFSIARIPETMFRVVAVNLPDTSVPAPMVASAASSQWFPGSASEFSQLSLTFIVDEDLKNYEEIFRWLTQQRYDIGAGFSAANTKEASLTSDGTLITLTNASNPNRVIRFKDLFPTSLSGLDFDTRNSDPIPVECTATFYFSQFTIDSIAVKP